MALNDTQLVQLISQLLPDNTSEDITPEDLRDVLLELVRAKLNLTQLDGFAQLASPAFTGVPQVPTAPAGTATNQVASTGFVQQALAALAGSRNLSELLVPQAVIAGNWYLTLGGIWEPRRNFTASADPASGPNWRQVASFTGPAVTITADAIADASPAGRRLLTAPSAAAQRALLGNPSIIAGQYGDHPSWSTEDGDAGLFPWLIKGVLAAGAVKAPDAPTNGVVNDNAKEFTFKVNPLYPSYLQYKEGGRPGTTSAAFLSAATAYQVGDTVHVTGLSGASKAGVAYYVGGSGNRPDGQPLVNQEAFTGSATPTQSLTVGLAIAVAAILAGNPLLFTVSASGGAGGYSYAVVATNTASGASVTIGSDASGSWTPTTAGDYELTATVTDSAGMSKISKVRPLHVNVTPLANAGSDNVLTQPTSAITLQGSGYEPLTSITGYSWSQSAGPASATFSSKTVAQPTVSGLTAVGDYHFQLIVTDAQGNVSLADEVVVTVQAAAASTTGKILWIPIGDSITNGDQANPGYVVATLNRLGNPANVTLRKRGFSGKTSEWYRQNERQNDLDYIQANLATYDRIVVSHSFGANDLTNQYSDTEAKGVANVYASFQQTVAPFKALSSKVVVVMGGVLNRTDGYATATFDPDRTQLDDLLLKNYSSFADDYVAVRRQPTVGGSSAPNSTVYFADKVHPATQGAAILAEEYAYTLAPWFGLVLNPAYQPNLGVTASAGGSTNDSLPADPDLTSYGHKVVQNTIYDAGTHTASKSTTGADSTWNGITQVPIKFGAGRIHVHLPSAGLAYNPNANNQSIIVALLGEPLDTSKFPAGEPYRQVRFGLYWDAQKNGPIEYNSASPLFTTAWPTNNFPNLDIVVSAADANGVRTVTYYAGDRPTRTTTTTLTEFYLYTFHYSNSGSQVVNLTVSGDNVTSLVTSRTLTAPEAVAWGGLFQMQKTSAGVTSQQVDQSFANTASGTLGLVGAGKVRFTIQDGFKGLFGITDTRTTHTHEEIDVRYYADLDSGNAGSIFQGSTRTMTGNYATGDTIDFERFADDTVQISQNGTALGSPYALPGAGVYFPSCAVWQGAVVAQLLSGEMTASGF